MRRLLFTLLVVASACDKASTPTINDTPATGPAPAPVPVETSRLGEYHWIQGQTFVERGRLDDGIAAFQEALSRFEADKKEIPAALFCDTGAALRKKTGDARSAEQAARLLHRCLLTAAPGTVEHVRALRELVELEPLGLDPALLARDTLADSYLTKPARASGDNLKVSVARTKDGGDRGYEAWAKTLEGPAARAVFVTCFDAYATASHKSGVTLVLPVKLRARTGDDDEYVGGTMEQLADPSMKGAEDAAQKCVRDGLAPLAVEFAKGGSSGSWSGTYSVTLAIQ